MTKNNKAFQIVEKILKEGKYDFDGEITYLDFKVERKTFFEYKVGVDIMNPDKVKKTVFEVTQSGRYSFKIPETKELHNLYYSKVDQFYKERLQKSQNEEDERINLFYNQLFNSNDQK